MEKRIEKKGPEDCSWFPFNDEPLVSSLWYVPEFADPHIIPPDKACDGKWHLFFHSWIGIHHFISNSGIAWEPLKVIELRGHSPFVYMENGCYYLLYEKHSKNLNSGKTGYSRITDTSSRIEMRSSSDLVTWSKPRVVLEAKDISFSGDYIPRPRISNPQLFKINGIYRLYFGASYVVLPDSHRKVSRYFSCAVSPDIQGTYIQENENTILIEPQPDSLYSNLACGNIRIVEHEGYFYAFQCAAYWDENKRKTNGAMLILKSYDGLKWENCLDKPILTTSEKGWADSYITGCDVLYSNKEKSWYCYYSAQGHNSRNIKTQSLGLLLGTVPVVSESKDNTLRSVLSSFFG